MLVCNDGGIVSVMAIVMERPRVVEGLVMSRPWSPGQTAGVNGCASLQSQLLPLVMAARSLVALEPRLPWLPYLHAKTSTGLAYIISSRSRTTSTSISWPHTSLHVPSCPACKRQAPSAVRTLRDGRCVRSLPFALGAQPWHPAGRALAAPTVGVARVHGDGTAGQRAAVCAHCHRPGGGR